MKAKTIFTAIAATLTISVCAGTSQSTRATADAIRAKVAEEIRAMTSAELSDFVSYAVDGAGTAKFDFKANRGHFTVRTETTAFTTKWSAAGADTVYAYRDCVEFVGWKEGQTTFPENVSDFLGWDWKRRCVDAKKGCVVAFMNKDGRFCAVRIVNICDRDRGAATDELQIEYRVY